MAIRASSELPRQGGEILRNFWDMKPSIPPVLITFALVCSALVQNTQAVSPPPDGGYSGGNTAEGTDALFSLTSGVWNTALGYRALYHVTTGTQNTATGYQTLFSNTTGSLSTAYGSQSLYHNTTGSFNTATGFRTLYANTTGYENTANGFEALAFTTTGFDNTANGFKALYNNTTGSGNTAVGSTALFRNTSGESNTATGEGALSSNGAGSGNTADGANTLSGRNGNVIPDWSNNTAVGANALIGQIGDLENNTAIGAEALPLSFGGQNNIAIGYRAAVNLVSGDNNIYVGNLGVDFDSGSVRIGTAGTQTQTFIAGINGTAVTGTPVVVDGNGQLGVAASSARFKDEIKPMDKASEAILALKPVTFRYKPEIDAKGAPQFGLLAEDVAKVNRDLVVHDATGKPYTVRYDAVNAMLLNEFLKEHKAFLEEQRTVEDLKKEVAALTAGLQKVSAQLEANKPKTQVVANNH